MYCSVRVYIIIVIENMSKMWNSYMELENASYSMLSVPGLHYIFDLKLKVNTYVEYLYN